MAGWQFKETSYSGSFEFGSGYPAGLHFPPFNISFEDPVTQKWLSVSMDPIFGFPSVVRFSWKTCTSILQKEAVKVNWYTSQGKSC